MKKYLKITFFLLAIAFIAASCQEETHQRFVSPEALTKSSPLTTKLQRVAMANLVDDNILDSATCFQIKLPVEVTVNGQFLLVQNEADYQQVANIFNLSNGDTDSLEFGFPITIQYENGEDVLVGDATQMQELRAQCSVVVDPDHPPIQCVDLVFPFSISLYDASSQTPQIVTINNNFEILAFIASLTPSQYFQINYPIIIIGSGGFTNEILNNTALLAFINEFGDNCNSCPNPNILTDDLVMYIPFANEIIDLTGFSVPLPADSDYHFVTDRSGNPNGAFSFDSGAANNIIQTNANQNNNLLQGNGFTISFWFNRQNAAQVAFEQLYNNTEMEISLGNQFNQQIRSPFVFATGMIDPVYDTGWIQDGLLGEIDIWHHIVITYDDQTMYLYRDGVLQSGSSAVDFGQVLLGGGVFGGNFKGYIDDIRMYKRVLGGEEISILYELDGDVNTCLN